MKDLKRYTIWLFKTGRESAGIERVVDTSDDLDTALLKYSQAIKKYSHRLIVLCDRATVLKRSGRLKAMP
jgi:hypothetical protein